MYVHIYCSSCGTRRRLSTTRGSIDALATIRAGWHSYGGALYCPKCSKTWSFRNRKMLSDDINTLADILDVEIRCLEHTRQEG